MPLYQGEGVAASLIAIKRKKDTEMTTRELMSAPTLRSLSLSRLLGRYGKTENCTQSNMSRMIALGLTHGFRYSRRINYDQRISSQRGSAAESAK